jgi:hypothetical protein
MFALFRWDHVSGFAVDGGTVTELPDSPPPGTAGAQPIRIVVT